MVIHEAGYGATSINADLRQPRRVPSAVWQQDVELQWRRSADQISGTFFSTPTGESGTCTTVTN